MNGIYLHVNCMNALIFALYLSHNHPVNPDGICIRDCGYLEMFILLTDNSDITDHSLYAEAILLYTKI